MGSSGGSLLMLLEEEEGGTHWAASPAAFTALIRTGPALMRCAKRSMQLQLCESLQAGFQPLHPPLWGSHGASRGAEGPAELPCVSGGSERTCAAQEVP